MGTATTTDNARQLTRLSDRVVFCFDGDRAGRAAAWRALESVLPFGGGSVEIGFVLLPEGEDPDSFVRSRGAAAFTDLVAAATPLSGFLLAEARAELDLGHADGKARLIAKLRPMLQRLARGVYRDLVTADLAAAVGMSAESLERALEHGGQPPSAPGPVPPRAAQRSTVMRKLLTLALHYPRAAAGLGAVDGLDELETPGAELLRNVLTSVTADPNTNAAALVEAYRDDPAGRYLRDLAAVEPLDSGDKAADVLREGIAHLVQKQRQAQKVAEIRARARKL